MNRAIQIPGLVQITDLIVPHIAKNNSGGIKGQCMMTFMRLDGKQRYNNVLYKSA